MRARLEHGVDDRRARDPRREVPAGHAHVVAAEVRALRGARQRRWVRAGTAAKLPFIIFSKLCIYYF